MNYEDLFFNWVVLVLSSGSLDLMKLCSMNAALSVKLQKYSKMDNYFIIINIIKHID